MQASPSDRGQRLAQRTQLESVFPRPPLLPGTAQIRCRPLTGGCDGHPCFLGPSGKPQTHCSSKGCQWLRPVALGADRGMTHRSLFSTQEEEADTVGVTMHIQGRQPAPSVSPALCLGWLHPRTHPNVSAAQVCGGMWTGHPTPRRLTQRGSNP